MNSEPTHWGLGKGGRSESESDVQKVSHEYGEQREVYREPKIEQQSPKAEEPSLPVWKDGTMVVHSHTNAQIANVAEENAPSWVPNPEGPPPIRETHNVNLPCYWGC